MALPQVDYDYYSHNGEIVIVSKTQLPQNGKWIFAAEAADIMGVSVGNVAYLCRKGRIRCQKWGNTWQVSKEDAENYERSKRNPTWFKKSENDNEG